MYSATCQNCGGVLTSQTPGPVRIGCPCGWVGHLTMLPSPNAGPNAGPNARYIGPNIGGLMVAPPVPPATSKPTAQPAEQQPSAEDNRRAHTRQRLYGLASAVADLLRTLDTEDWGLPLWARYERLQRAHSKLFEALGGARNVWMGAYRPPSAPVEAAVVELLLWELLLLDGAEQRL